MSRPLKSFEVKALLEDSSDEYRDEECESDSENEVDQIISVDSEESQYTEDEFAAADTWPLVHEECPMYFSKNDEEIWLKEPIKHTGGRKSKKDVLVEQCGTTRFAKMNITDLKSTFFLFFRNTLLEKIVKWTNKEGQLQHKQNWTNATVEEMKRLLGVLILIGVYQSKNEEVNQLWSETDGRPIFNKIMPRNRFQAILRVLRFDDAEARRKNRSSNKTEPIDDVFEEWNKYLGEAYKPGWCLTVDEQLVTFRGRCPFKQYLPSKPGKYGIKFWALCDSETSYCLKLLIYKGREPGEERGVNVGEKVVKSLASEYVNAGRNITCDNFFTSIGLARYLLSKNTTIVGQ